MHSPKFANKKDDLSKIVNSFRLKSTWKSKVRNAMRNQPIPDVVENLDFHVNLEARCTSISNEILTALYIPRPATRLLSEKSKGLCRQIVIPTVKDALILQTLSDAIWTEIKHKSPTSKSFYAPEDHSFSKTINGEANPYGPVQAWLNFQKEIIGFTKDFRYIIVTDIANYYDSISYDHLRNILSDLSLSKEHALDLLIYTLSHMLWQPDYMPRVPVGLPQISLDAPRLLAHSFLFEIDKLLDSQKDTDFTRFMDDIDIGVDSIARAKSVLRDLDLSLQTRQIRLNSGKTKILSHAEARIHFCIRENAFLDKIQSHINSKLTTGSALSREQKFINNAISYGLRTQRFNKGNGEKILKRLLKMAKITGTLIKIDDFIIIMTNWPSSRSNVLFWWINSPAPSTYMVAIERLVTSKEIVDDLALFQISDALVQAPLPDVPYVTARISGILNAMSSTDSWTVVSKCWLLSKYGSNVSLMKLIESSVNTWITHEFISRLVGGMYPRFIGSPLADKFENIVRKFGTRWAQDVYDFHESLHKTKEGFTSVRKFIRATNASKPNKISHSKFLMMISLLNNSSVAPTASTELKTAHPTAVSDPFYLKLIP